MAQGINSHTLATFLRLLRPIMGQDLASSSLATFLRPLRPIMGQDLASRSLATTFRMTMFLTTKIGRSQNRNRPKSML